MKRILLLTEMNSGDSGMITSVKGSGAVNRRIRDMGVVPGTKVLVEKRAPLGDPIEIEVRGYHLTLRKSEAETIHVEVTP